MMNASSHVPSHGGRTPKKSGLSIQKDYKTGKHVTFKPAQNKKAIKDNNINCSACH